MFTRRRDPVERFNEKVNKTDGCWIWTGAAPQAYGQFATTKGQWIGAHRFSYELHVGPIPEGLHIDHLCRNPLCVNPAHLEAVTQRENILRGVGATARNFRKTHCLRGHEFTPENTRLRGANNRQCLACERLRRKPRR